MGRGRREWIGAGLRDETPQTPAAGYKWTQTPALNRVGGRGECRYLGSRASGSFARGCRSAASIHRNSRRRSTAVGRGFLVDPDVAGLEVDRRQHDHPIRVVVENDSASAEVEQSALKSMHPPYVRSVGERGLADDRETEPLVQRRFRSVDVSSQQACPVRSSSAKACFSSAEPNPLPCERGVVPIVANDHACSRAGSADSCSSAWKNALDRSPCSSTIFSTVASSGSGASGGRTAMTPLPESSMYERPNGSARCSR